MATFFGFAFGCLFAYAVTSIDMSIATFFLPVTVIGLGMGLIMAQLANLALSSVAPEDTSEASGVNNALGELGNSMGTAVIGSLLLMFFYTGLVDRIARRGDLHLSYQERNELIVQLEDAPDLATQAGRDSLVETVPENVRESLPFILEDATVAAMQDTLLVIVGFILLTLLVSTFLPDRRIEKDDRQRFREASGFPDRT